MESKKRITLVLVGALCIVIGIASIALANESTGDAGELPVFGWGRQMGRRLLGCAPEAVTGAIGSGFMRRFGEDARNLEMNPRMVLVYIAGKTGTPIETLYQEYMDGKTLEEIAEAYGVDWAEIEAAIRYPVPGRFMSKERLEAAIQRVTENIARTEERLETFLSKLPEYEARIAETEDETLREFAERHLDILKQRCELGDDHLSILQQRLELLKDQLDYAKSR
jgi:uncharacterized protein (DUF433 family)